jgi:4-amino-4-deoxy-L-arabinose transferase-like glycosyltransferase
MSRTAYDANLALFLTVLTFWLFYRGLTQKKIWYSLGAIISACVAMLTYQSSKIVVPLVLLMMVLIWFEDTKKIISNAKRAIILAIIILTFGIPTLSAFFYKGSLFRFSSLSVFDNPDTVKIAADRQVAGFSNFFVNRRLLGLENGISHYLDNFHPTYLFSPTVFSTQFQTPNDNYFHLFDLVLVFVGVLTIFSKIDRKKKLFLLSWLLLAPLPTTFVEAAPKITRVLPLIPVVIFISAFGFERLWNKSKWLVIIPYGLTIIMFFYSFFRLFNFENAKFWQTGYKEMVDKALAYNTKTYVSNSLQLPYIYFLWYGKIDPVEYLKQGGTRTGNILAADNTVDNFVFHGLTKEIFDNASDKDLFIGYPDDFRSFGHVVDRVGCVAKQECIWFVRK